MVSIKDVRIKHSNIWISANEMQIKAYRKYKWFRYFEQPLTISFYIYSNGTYYESQILLPLLPMYLMPIHPLPL